MLTARKTNRDIVHGLNVGADDYLTKPYDLDELLARMRAVARSGAVPLAVVLTSGDLMLNTANREVRRGIRILDLTKTEYGLLELLIRNAGSRGRSHASRRGRSSHTRHRTLGSVV